MSAHLPITYRPAIGALLQSCNLPLAGNGGAEDHLDSFQVATAEGRIVACAAIERHGNAALLRSCAVDEPYRRQGLGHELVQQAINRATALGIGELVLLTTTAENYFARFGFKRVSRDDVAGSLMASQEFRGACPASACVMRLTLAP